MTDQPVDDGPRCAAVPTPHLDLPAEAGPEVAQEQAGSDRTQVVRSSAPTPADATQVVRGVPAAADRTQVVRGVPAAADRTQVVRGVPAAPSAPAPAPQAPPWHAPAPPAPSWVHQAPLPPWFPQHQGFPQWQAAPQHAGGRVLLDTRFFPLALVLHLFGPRVLIDGHEVRARWGQVPIDVAAGYHRLRVGTRYLFGVVAWAELDVLVQPGQQVPVFYTTPATVFLAGSIGFQRQPVRGAVLVGVLTAVVVLVALLGAILGSTG